MRWALLWPLSFGLTRSFIIESTGASLTRGDATAADKEKLASMRAIWREPSLRIIGTIGAVSVFLLVPYLLYANWLIYGVLQVAAIAGGSFLGFACYRMRALNNVLMRLTAPPLLFIALYFCLRS